MENLVIFNNREIILIFFKAFSLIFSFLYFIFSLITFQQTKAMTKIVKLKESEILIFLSFIQLILSIILFTAAFFL